MSSRVKYFVIIFWSIIFITAIVRCAIYYLNDEQVNNACLGDTVIGTGKVVDEPEIKEKSQVIVVETISLNNLEKEKCEVNQFIRIKTKLYPRFSFNDSVSFEGKLSKPANFRSDDGREFNYKGYLAKDDIFFEIKSAVVKSLDSSLSDMRATEESKSIIYSDIVSLELFNIKKSFVNNLNKVLGEPYSALAAGLVVGEKSALGKKLLDDFRTVGLIHIIVLSGFNITIVADALRRILSFLPRVWGIVIGGIGIILFGILVGGGATVVRSCFMAGIALTAEIIRRGYDVRRALVLAGLIMIIQNPSILVYDPSFQLSFLATSGLILFASPIEKKLFFITEKFGLRGIIASTLATQIFVSPFILYTMGQISVIGTVVNILVLPIIPLTMLMVFMTGAIGFISLTFSYIFGLFTHILLLYEISLVNFFAKIPLASINVPMFSGWVTVFVYGFILSIYGIFTVGFERENKH